MILNIIFTLVAGAVLLGAYILSKAVYLVQQSEVLIIERFGKYYKTLQPGIHVVMPLIDVPRTSTWVFVQEGERGRYYRITKTITRLDLRETVYDFPKQNVITKDNVTMDISALLYYQITDARAAVYEVANLPEAIERLTHSTLRNLIGELDLDETLTSRDRINHKLRDILDEATDKWGVKINRVELQEVTPPADIRQAMEKQMRAERERRAVIKEAEGVKAAAILEAEGRQQAQVLSAEGAARAQVIAADAEAQARLTISKAEAQALEFIRQALPQGDPAKYLIAVQYVHALPKIMEGKNNKMIVVPYEAAGLTSAVAGMRELFQQQAND
jgi:regulator of protease activity HflC (stomatin/prohibitin superfamily)